MADKKITPKAASSKDKATGDRAAARVSLKRTHQAGDQARDQAEEANEEELILDHTAIKGGRLRRPPFASSAAARA